MKNLAVLIFVSLSLTACQSMNNEQHNTSNKLGMANPASVFCNEQGGKSEIITADDGSQYGICHLPDGTTVEEWTYFREKNQ